MKYILTINELFDTKSDIIIDNIERTPARYYAHYIYVTIKGYKYKFTMQLKNSYIYFSYRILDWRELKDDKVNNNQYSHGKKIDTFNEYDFVVNDSMLISVLNCIPIVTEAFIDEAVKDGLSKEIVKGIYYDADEKRRERIYKYFFSKKLPNSAHRKELGWEFFDLETPVLLKDFKIF